MIDAGEKLDISDEKRQSKGGQAFQQNLKKAMASFGETEHSKGASPTSQVYTYSHWCLEIVALSLEFSIR